MCSIEGVEESRVRLTVSVLVRWIDNVTEYTEVTSAFGQMFFLRSLQVLVRKQEIALCAEADLCYTEVVPNFTEQDNHS